MRPHPPRKRAEALRLREQEGLGYNRIGQRLGISPTTVRRWVNPEYDAKQKADTRRRKREKYGGICVDCGARTAYTGRKPRGATRCLSCHRQYQLDHRLWTREKVIAAIQRWAREHEGRPPSASKWRKRGDYHPSYSAVYGSPASPFDRWVDAIEAAGFPRPFSPPGPGNIQWSKEEATRLREEGLPDHEIGRRMGVSASAIYQRLGRRPRPAPVPKKRTREQRINDLQAALKKENH